MAVKPTTQKVTGTTADIINAIRSESSANYKNAVGTVTYGDTRSLNKAGDAILKDNAFKNEFLSALWNRIARVIITAKIWDNPIAMLKRGELELGEIVEEAFVNLATPHEFNQAESEQKVFAREIADVRSSFYLMNYQKFYERTISNNDLKMAFLSWSGVEDLIAKMTETMYTSANYDENLTMRYLIARQILDGKMYPVTVGDFTTEESVKQGTKTVLALSDNMEMLSTEYNISGVYNYASKNEQYFLVTPETKSAMNVDVYATAFNMDRAEFMGHMVTVPQFGKLDTARLAQLFADDPNYVEIGEDKLQALNQVAGVMISSDWFMIFDNLNEFGEIYNPRGMYWNYYLHTWKTFGVSPFAVNAVLLPGTPTVTNVTVSPSSTTLAVGAKAELTAKVEGTNFPPSAVTWQSNSEHVTVDEFGVITAVSATSSPTTITATSKFDTAKKGTASITVTA